MLTFSKSSLVEQKKQQWAREREEMARLHGPWRSDTSFHIKNQFASSLELHKDNSDEYQENYLHRHRSPSLPPIKNEEQIIGNNLPPEKRFNFYEEDGEGDTSGYGSETFHHRKTNNGTLASCFIQNNISHNKGIWTRSDRWNNNNSTQNSSGEEGRLKWGDRGVATGKLWEPQDPNSRLPQMQIQKKGNPTWLERGLNMLDKNTTDTFVADQSSNRTGSNDYEISSCSGSDGGRSTFLRGQNIPIEPEIKAERETRRMKALENQSVILNQLEEREKRKKEERERILKEERLEELRLMKQQQEERDRMAEEKKRADLKQEQERKKLEALKKAVEDAEIKARQDKAYRWKNRNIENNDVIRNETNKIASPKCSKEFIEGTTNEKKYSPRKLKSSGRTQGREQEPIIESNQRPYGVDKNMVDENVNIYLTGLKNNDGPYSLLPLKINSDNLIKSENGLQLAVLIPHPKTSIYGLHKPLSLHQYSVSKSSEESSFEERMITPRKYRSKRAKDAATQTDAHLGNKAKFSEKQTDNEGSYKESDKSLEEHIGLDTSRTVVLRKDSRMRSEERYAKSEIEARPKWGVNRPTAKYKKQSEKDPFYMQKRKTRPRHRAQKQYYSQSSDDSRSPSPPTNSNEITRIRTRTTASQNYWRNKRMSQDYLRPSNASIETIDIKRLEFDDLGQINLKSDYNNIGDCNKSPGKRLTLSQKFINDKYGVRKLCDDLDIKYKISTKERANTVEQNDCPADARCSRRTQLEII